MEIIVKEYGRKYNIQKGITDFSFSLEMKKEVI